MTSGNNVYEVKRVEKEVVKKDGSIEIKKEIVEKKLMARVYALSTFYNDKGSIFDKDFLNDPAMRYNIAIDEFQREKGEKQTFDILYSLVNQLENLVRSTKERTNTTRYGRKEGPQRVEALYPLSNGSRYSSQPHNSFSGIRVDG